MVWIVLIVSPWCHLTCSRVPLFPVNYSLTKFRFNFLTGLPLSGGRDLCCLFAMFTTTDDQGLDPLIL